MARSVGKKVLENENILSQIQKDGPSLKIQRVEARSGCERLGDWKINGPWTGRRVVNVAKAATDAASPDVPKQG